MALSPRQLSHLARAAAHAPRRHRGATLIELLVTCGVFSFMVISLFALVRGATGGWRAVDSRTQVQSQLRNFEVNLTADLQRTSLASVRIYGSKADETYKHAIALQSALNDSADPGALGDPLYFQLNTATPSLPNATDAMAPLWQRWIIYYLTRPQGDTCDVASNPDNVCPHKWIIRKDLKLSAPVTDSTSLEPYIGANPAVDPSLSDACTPGGDVVRSRIIARNILALNFYVVSVTGANVGTNDTTSGTTYKGAPKAGGKVVLFDVKAFKELEAASMISIGHKALTSDTASAPTEAPPVPYTVQLDNRVAPMNP